MTESDIQFGDIAEPQPHQRLRPDRNQQLAVVSCGRPDDADLPIFVDLDAMQELQRHALSDVCVELGGVLLGGQYRDDEGRPYVVIADSLRAQHSESSRHSFKFTHDTWAEITRERAAFPPDLQMVGWYHTHPDHGVFLSGMDLFICDNFFRRDLDVALVIDPCRQECGWFHWTGDRDTPIRRTGGFCLYASRHRRAEVELLAAQLEGRVMATRDPRAAEWGVFAGATPPPSWPPADARLSWLGLAVLGLLCGQMLLLAILAWEVLLAPVAAARSQPAPALAKPSPSREAGGPSAEIEQRAQEIDAQTRVLDRVLAELGRDGPDGAVRLLQEAQAENEQLKADARVYRSLEARVNADNARLGRELAAAESEVTRLRTQVAELSRSVAEHEAREREHERQIAALQQPPDSDADAAGGGSLVDWRNLPPAWLWGGGAATLAVLIAIGWGWGLAARRAQATGERDHATAPDGPAEA